MFEKATRSGIKLRMALAGPAGAGKTFSALSIASHLGVDKIMVADAENDSARKYSDKFDFFCANLEDGSPRSYIKAIEGAEEFAPNGVLILDGLTPLWIHALERVDNISQKQGNNNYTAWRYVTPEMNQFVDKLLYCKVHIIATMRSKTKYELQKNEDTGKNEVVKLGLEPIMRQGIDYEFDIVGDLDLEHRMTISKTRCSSVDGKVYNFPGEEFATAVREWLDVAPPARASKEDVPQVTNFDAPKEAPKEKEHKVVSQDKLVDLIKALNKATGKTVMEIRKEYLDGKSARKMDNPKELLKYHAILEQELADASN